MHKFFVDKRNITEKTITIDGDDVKHISKVLRLRQGDEVLVSDGKCNEYTAVIDLIDKKEVICSISNSFKNETESDIKITLFQGLPKSTKMELIIQKGVEIGIDNIIPVITDRVVVKTEARDLTNKIDRWNKIAKEAAKQSGRGRVMEIEPPISFSDALNKTKDFDLAVMPYENANDEGLKKVLSENREAKNIAIFIGPEGGFEESEVSSSLNVGVCPVTLGPRILRTETAGLVASTIILYEIGDMGGKI
ncbi:MAG: 16S rRNA (uracil(1498)-N(3))-methyltransferase [Clostridium sp.]